MSRWDHIADLWSPDNPAVVRLRNALQPAQDAPERPFPMEPAHAAMPEPPPRLSESERRERIAVLVARLEAESADPVAADQLRRLLDQR